MAGPILETERLVLREYELSDLDDLAAILGDPETMRFYPRPFTREEARAWIEANVRRYRDHGFGQWALVLKETGELAGDSGPVKRDVLGVEEVEIGWRVKRALWRRGLATEAGAACRDHAFAELGLHRVVSLIRPVNTPSRRVAEKLGMHVEKEIVWFDFPHLVYVMEREEPVRSPR